MKILKTKLRRLNALRLNRLNKRFKFRLFSSNYSILCKKNIFFCDISRQFFSFNLNLVLSLKHELSLVADVDFIFSTIISEGKWRKRDFFGISIMLVTVRACFFDKNELLIKFRAQIVLTRLFWFHENCFISRESFARASVKRFVFTFTAS